MEGMARVRSTRECDVAEVLVMEGVTGVGSSLE